MSASRFWVSLTRLTPAYRRGLAFGNVSEAYDRKTMLEFIAFSYMFIVQENGDIRKMDRFFRQMGITSAEHEENQRLGMRFKSTDSEALTVAFTYLIGKNERSTELIEIIRKLEREFPDGISYRSNSN